MIYHAVQLRLYPNSDQHEALLQNVGCARFVYNYFLDKRIKHYKKSGKSLAWLDTCKLVINLKRKKGYEWLQNAHTQSLYHSLKNLDQAFKNFFRRIKNGEIPGFPKFKKKGINDSFGLPQDCRIEANHIKLGKHGFIKFRGCIEDLEGRKLKTVTISLKAGKWFASCLYELNEKDIIPTEPEIETVGIDVGIKQPLTLAFNKGNSTTFQVLGKKYSRILRKKEHARKKAQRNLARKKMGSHNREKAKLKVQRAYLKEANYRKNWIEQTSNYLTQRFHCIKFEDLKMSSMTKKGTGKQSLNRELSRLGLSNLIARTLMKAKERGNDALKICARYTSQACSKCGFISKKNRKSQARFKCIECGYSKNADKNAAINILYADV